MYIYRDYHSVITITLDNTDNTDNLNNPAVDMFKTKLEQLWFIRVTRVLRVIGSNVGAITGLSHWKLNHMIHP